MFGKHQIQNHGEIWQDTKQEWSPSASHVHRIQYQAMCVTRRVLCGFTFYGVVRVIFLRNG